MLSSLSLLSFGPGGYGDEIAHGVRVTMALSLATLPCGLLVGFVVALAKQSHDKVLRLGVDIYTTVFRALPELVTVFIIYYGMEELIDYGLRSAGLSLRLDVNTFVAGLIALSIVFSAYACEIFVSGMKAIPAGQYESGSSLGLSFVQTRRLIILPQLIRIVLPGLANQWLVLLKDTALISVIGLTDIMRQTHIVAHTTHRIFLFYFTAFLLYLALAMLSSLAIRAIENHVRRLEAA
ncbi:MAG: ABC transporter permease subunit [Hyphomicrobiales bacterium]